jgi:hypothetical protein
MTARILRSVIRALLLLALVISACAPTVTPSPVPLSVAVVAPTPTASPPPSPNVPLPTPLATAPQTTPPLDAATASLINELNAWCGDRPPLATPPLPLGVIGRLADGRSARETAALLGRSACAERLKAGAYGEGASEVVTVGGYGADGAVLWVDAGYWRIASVPIDYGYLDLRWDVQRQTERELFFTILSGGSGGAAGLLAVGITGDEGRLTLHARPGASQMGARTRRRPFRTAEVRASLVSGNGHLLK